MAAYADTSFLFSLVVNDANSAAAAAYLRKHRAPLVLCPLQEMELRNAVRLAVFRQQITPAVAQNALRRVEESRHAGDLRDVHLSWPDTLHAANQVGAAHTATLGIRMMDLLHLGAALSLGQKDFLSFDQSQKTGAKAAGLRVGP